MPDSTDPTNWTQKLRDNPAEAIDQLFREHYRFLCLAVYRIIPDRDTAEDLVQDVFVELWRKHRQLTVQQSMRAYLKRSAVNKALNYIRDRKIHLVDTPLNPIPALQPPVVQQLAAEELQQYIDAAIDRLPERCRLVFVLSRFEEMSYKEISDKLGISVKTVENQVSKALRLLRDQLGPYL